MTDLALLVLRVVTGGLLAATVRRSCSDRSAATGLTGPPLAGVARSAAGKLWATGAGLASLSAVC